MKRGLLVWIAILFSVPAFANNVNLQWNRNPEPDVVGYYVYRATMPGAYNYNMPVNTSPVPQPPTGMVVYTDSTAPNALIYYVVRAVNTAGAFSASSNEVMVPPLGPSAPTGLTVVGVTASLQLRIDGTLVATGPSPLMYTIPRQTPPRSYALTITQQ